jgi:tetratricopeptide (TPR) repeat protein
MRLFFICVILCRTCFSQVNDSLLYQLNQIPNDTERVNQIYQAGFGIRNSDPDISYQYAVACKTEALKTKSPLHLAKSYNLLGILCYKKGDYKNALQFQKLALGLNSSVNHTYGIAINQTNLGNIYSDLRQYALAESCYLSALQAYNRLNNTLHITKILINIGVLKYEQKQFESAIRQFKEALVYVEEVKDHDLKASCYNNLGTIYREKGALDTAELYLEDAINLYALTDAKMELADAYNNMAIVYIKTQNFEGALDYIQTAEGTCKEYDFTETLLELYDTHSMFYEAQKNYEQAFFWTKKYDSLKDSLLNIEKENTITEVLYEPAQETSIEEHSPIHNKPLLVLLLILLISIPFFLIRQSR